MTRIAVGLSGGVDSSVAAAILLEQGHDLLGVTLRLGIAELHGRSCCGEKEALLARRACDVLGIQHTVVNVASAFAKDVVGPFAEAYARGETPNPCIACNEHVKLPLLLDRARSHGCEAVATGHYAQISSDETPLLMRALDRDKDQSYFLYRVPSRVLGQAVFPLGRLTKREVREYARARGLPSADRAESQDVCFTDDHVALVERIDPGAVRPGPITTQDGVVLGEHRGLAYYTVGQRKKLGLGDVGGPWQVIMLDAERNVVIVGRKASLFRRRFTLRDVIWHASTQEIHAEAVIRYGASHQAAVARLEGEYIDLVFDSDVETTAPGQSIVLYQGEVIVGGGVVVGPGE